MDKLLSGVSAAIDFRLGAKQRIGTEDKVNPRAGPPGFTRLAIAAFKQVGVLRDRLPLRAHVEQVHEEIIAQLDPFKDTGAIKFDYEYLLKPEIADIARHLLGSVAADAQQ